MKVAIVHGVHCESYLEKVTWGQNKIFLRFLTHLSHYCKCTEIVFWQRCSVIKCGIAVYICWWSDGLFWFILVRDLAWCVWSADIWYCHLPTQSLAVNKYRWDIKTFHYLIKNTFLVDQCLVTMRKTIESSAPAFLSAATASSIIITLHLRTSFALITVNHDNLQFIHHSSPIIQTIFEPVEISNH